MLNENEVTTINFDNSKRRKNIIIGVGLMFLCAVFIGLIVSADVIKIFYLAIFVVIFVTIAVLLIKVVREINSKDQVGLVLNREGITFNGTIAAKKIGKIHWTDIESLELKEVYRTKQLYLKLKNPQKYIKEISKIELVNNGLFINATELNLSFEELTNLTAKYLNKYGESGAPTI